MPCDHHVWAFSMCAQVTFQTVNVLYQLHAICQESLYGAHCSLYGSTAFLKQKFEQYMGDINCSDAIWGLKVAYWLKHWTADRKVQGSSPTCSRDLFLFWVHSALPQKLSRGLPSCPSEGTLSRRSRGTP